MTAKHTNQDQIAIIGKNIDRLLDENNMTQSQLSEILGLSESAIGKWVLGKNAPAMGNIQRMADYFGVKVSDIVENKPQNILEKQRRYLLDKVEKASPKQLEQLRKMMEILNGDDSAE